ncbi:MAG: hypothetical protein JXR77_03260, partial [Lentisphaeria bacterium]|nr:hypothetical protein [Lentisphaeria bacterium]
IDSAPEAPSTADGRTRLTLELPPHGSVFVVFRDRATPGAGRRPGPMAPSRVLRFPGAWEVEFQAGRGAPERTVFESLVDWSRHPEDGIRYFSGTAIYRRTFEITAEEAERKAVLRLGTVAALAQVHLNGTDLGVVWTAPWQAELTGALRPGRNELEIAVTNPWANRLVGDAGLPPEQRITRSNMQFEKGKRTLRPFQGFASEDMLQPSGLMGPVTLELF